MDTFVTKAARLNGPRDIELIERELVCGEDDIIVKNHLMGICGSDKNFYRGYLPPKTAEFRQDPKFPFLLGHESGGTVVAVGSRVADYKVGDKVMAFGWNNNFAEYFAAKSFQLQPVPYGLDMDIASLGEPISCAMYSGLNSGVQLGDTVVVMGGGFAGQIIAQCARRKGAYRVIVVDVLEGKLAFARRHCPEGPCIVYSTASPDRVAATQARFGREAAGAMIERVLADIAAALVETGVRRILVAGGETSGAVVSRLGVRALRIGETIAPGVPWTETLLDPANPGAPHLALALKSGNFGGEDFFMQALGLLANAN